MAEFPPAWVDAVRAGAWSRPAAALRSHKMERCRRPRTRLELPSGPAF